MGDRNFSQRVYFLFDLFMILLYVVAGIILIFVWPPADILPEFNRIGLGIVLLSYSIYRVYRIWKKEKASKIILESNEN